MNPVPLAVPVAAGAVLGVLIRWAAVDALGSSLGDTNTIVVNGVGCLLMGMFVHRGWRDEIHMAATVGLCGGLTTFSTFALDAAIYFDNARWVAGLLYVLATAVVSAASYLFGRQIHRVSQ